MRPRAPNIQFSNFFTRADRAYVDWQLANKSTMLTGDKWGGVEPAAPGLTPGLDKGSDVANTQHDIVRAIERWYDAKRVGDASALIDAARSVIGATRAVQDERGVQPHQREPLPHAFVATEAKQINESPPTVQPAILRSVLNSFDDHVKDGVLGQFAVHLPQSLIASVANANAGQGVLGRGSPVIRDAADRVNDAMRFNPMARPLRGAAVDHKSDAPVLLAGGYGGGRYGAKPEKPQPTPVGQDWRKQKAPPAPSRPGCVANETMVTCRAARGDFEPISFPRPPGWPDEMSGDEYDYHEYRYETVGDYVPPPEDEEAYRERLFQELINDPTPGRNVRATPEGQTNDVGPLLAPDGWPEELRGANNVKSYVIEQNGQKFVVNVTEPGHALKPGYVVRTVVRMPDGRYAIVTFGSGTALIQSPKWTPSVSIPPVPSILPDGAEIPSVPNPLYEYADDHTKDVWDKHARELFARARKPRPRPPNGSQTGRG